jgi:hypothetical protein
LDTCSTYPHNFGWSKSFLSNPASPLSKGEEMRESEELSKGEEMGESEEREERISRWKRGKGMEKGDLG